MIIQSHHTIQYHTYGQGCVLIYRYHEISEIELLKTNGNPQKVSMQDIVIELESELY